MSITLRAAWQESIYRLKGMLRNSRFTLAVVFILAIGLGSVTFLYSIVTAVLFKNLPYKDPNALVSLWEYNTKGDHLLNHVSPANLETWRRENRSFTEIGAYDISKDLRMTLTGAGTPERLRIVKIDASLLHLLGVSPVIGRMFDPGEDEAGRDHVLLLSARLWTTAFGGARNIVGRTIILDHTGYTVIGVMPAAFTFPAGTGTFNPSGEQRFEPPDAWIPLALTAEQKGNRGAHWLQAIAKLKRNVSPEQGDAELDVIQRRILAEHPNDYVGSDARVVSLHRQAVATIRPTIIALFGAVSFMVLVACLNVANLFLVRGTEKQRDYAIRLALGADRALLVWSAVSEILLTCFIAAVVAILLAYGMVQLWKSFPIMNWIDRSEVVVNWNVLVFVFVMALFTALLVGIFPMLRANKTSVQTSLREDARTASSSGAAGRSRNIGIVFQVGIAFTLVVVAGLLLQSLLRLDNVDSGFRPEGIMNFEVSLPDAVYQNPNQRRNYFDNLLNRIASLPGVKSVGATTSLPLSGDDPDTMVNIAGRSQDPNDPIIMNTQVVDPNYFATMGTPLKSGRFFSSNDGPNGPHVAMLNETAVRLFFRGENPLGKRVQQLPDEYYCQIVGIVGDVRHAGLDRDTSPEIYQSYLQSPQSTMSIVVKSGTPAVAPLLIRAVQQLDPEQPPPAVHNLEDIVSGSLAKPRFRTWLIGLLALATVALACLGIYSSVAYIVALRRREICIRVALGADHSDILWLILSHVMRLVVVGIVVGGCIALVIGRAIASLLFGTTPYDVLTYAAVAVGLGITALLSALWPAFRALAVQPRMAFE